MFDLAPVDENAPPEAGWALIPWEESMRRRNANHRTAWDGSAGHPMLGAGATIIGDTAKRQTFLCPNCKAVHVLRNVTLLRMVLTSIAKGDRKVRLR